MHHHEKEKTTGVVKQHTTRGGSSWLTGQGYKVVKTLSSEKA